MAASVDWVNAHPMRAFGLLTLWYLVINAALSACKLLWLDELLTVHVARAPTFGVIWRALQAGADPNPPLTDFAVHACIRVFGAHTYVYRMPAILGYWLGMLALFFFLKRLVPPFWAIVGVVMSIGMGGFEWSYEGRSYAIFYGTTMAALCCWHSAVAPGSRGSRRILGLAGMAIALFAGLCSNYFSALAFVPIAMGEIVRVLGVARSGDAHGGARRVLRAIDWRVWAALLIAAMPLIFFRGMMERAIRLYQPYAWNRVKFGATTIAYLDMVEAMLYPLGLLLLFAGLVWLLRLLCIHCRARLRPAWFRSIVDAGSPAVSAPRPYEIVPIAILALYPYLGWAVASLHGGMLSSRFVLPVCLGFAAIGAWLAYQTFGQHKTASSLILVFFVTWFLVREIYVGNQYIREQRALYRTYAALRTVDHFHEPIVVSDNLLILPFRYYAPPDVAARVVYPIDMAAIMNRRKEGSGEVNFWYGRNLYDFPLVPLAKFQRSASTYLMVTSEPDWLLDDLHAHNYPDDPLLVDHLGTGSLNYVATPLSHWRSEIFRAYGDAYDYRVMDPEDTYPQPFDLAGELPNGK